jgi:hypothetical protein
MGGETRKREDEARRKKWSSGEKEAMIGYRRVVASKWSFRYYPESRNPDMTASKRIPPDYIFTRSHLKNQLSSC